MVMDTVGSRNSVSASADHHSSVLDPIPPAKATFALLSDAARAPVSLPPSLALAVFVLSIHGVLRCTYVRLHWTSLT